ncbi:MAG TPA: NUDIX domain-containing protein [Candidatus Paceibacterota bacterium]|nr:NUDIX domain-containing protein [Verrucomicrobiota bacterium]HRY47134.1 NUDIX domain-containing protein [Candidatus Paceibacterota bacterium]HSA02622.1 NUDIX domain-containing protein [Candidatus Paceibacterota bacterium]
MDALLQFRFCPRCGQAHDPSGSLLPFRCQACGFVFYLNPASAAAALIQRSNGDVLFIRRAKNPAKGKLAVPGGFVDFGESIEDALRREVREEVGIEVGRLVFLCSAPNEYPYRGVCYQVVDLFFHTGLAGDGEPQALDAVESVCWLDPRRVPLDDLAFTSLKKALEFFRGTFMERSDQTP